MGLRGWTVHMCSCVNKCIADETPQKAWYITYLQTRPPQTHTQTHRLSSTHSWKILDLSAQPSKPVLLVLWHAVHRQLAAMFSFTPAHRGEKPWPYSPAAHTWITKSHANSKPMPRRNRDKNNCLPECDTSCTQGMIWMLNTRWLMHERGAERH